MRPASADAVAVSKRCSLSLSSLLVDSRSNSRLALVWTKQKWRKLYLSSEPGANQRISAYCKRRIGAYHKQRNIPYPLTHVQIDIVEGSADRTMRTNIERGAQGLWCGGPSTMAGVLIIIIIIVASYLAHMSVTQWHSWHCNIQYFLQDVRPLSIGGLGFFRFHTAGMM